MPAALRLLDAAAEDRLFETTAATVAVVTQLDEDAVAFPSTDAAAILEAIVGRFCVRSSYDDAHSRAATVRHAAEPILGLAAALLLGINISVMFSAHAWDWHSRLRHFDAVSF
jgi:hypothetical protein